MSQVIADWLRNEFASVPDVKSAGVHLDRSAIFVEHQADLVVRTWMGSCCYVYLIHSPPKARDLRGTLKHNSRSGVGTLFVVRRDLLPENDATVRINDWQEVLLTLYDRWIYSYILGDEGLSLAQVNFTPAAIEQQYTCWTLPEFGIENVSVRKREYNNGLRGTYFVGDISSPAYKRRVNAERVHQRFHYRTRYTSQLPDRRANDDQLMKYYQLIGVDRNASERDVKAAFRRMALQIHPDVSALPRVEAEQRIKALNEAYEFIKNYHGWR